MPEREEEHDGAEHQHAHELDERSDLPGEHAHRKGRREHLRNRIDGEAGEHAVLVEAEPQRMDQKRQPDHDDDAEDRGAAPASGSARTRGMIICPCSMGTLAALAAGTSRSLVERAGDVTLKERRPLILVVRETPLSVIHLENMLRLTRAGAIVLPAAPGFYNAPRDITDLVDFVVARVLDHIDVDHSLGRRWGAQPDGDA